MSDVKQDILRLWEEKQLRITDEIQTAPEVLYANGSVIGTLGNFSASTGKAKSKKTFNVAAIVGAALVNGKVLGYTAEFPDDKRTILYFDTEQSPYHCQKVMERALRLAKLPTDIHPENLKFAALRQLTPSLRLEVIEQAIINTPGVGLVIIDGVRDLMYDINCAKESTDLIGSTTIRDSVLTNSERELYLCRQKESWVITSLCPMSIQRHGRVTRINARQTAISH